MTHSSNIAVLGAGIMGLSAAMALQKAGHSVTLYDPKGFPAINASALAGGMIAPYSEIEHMDLRWVEAGLAGVRFWQEMDAMLDIGFAQKGSLLVACPEDRYILERFRAHLPLELQAYCTPQEIEPALDGKFSSGLYLAQEAHLNPAKTMQALCEALEDDITFSVSSVSPSSVLPSDWIIDCRGMAARCEEDEPDLRGVKGEIVIVRNPDFTLERPVRLMHPRYPLYIVPRPNHVFMIGATVIESDENEQVSLRSSMELMSALYALCPGFGEAEVLEVKAGIRPAYPDNLPRIQVRDNVISCNGLFRHGYLLAPVMARCVVDMLAGRENEFTPLFTKGADHEDHHQRAA